MGTVPSVAGADGAGLDGRAALLLRAGQIALLAALALVPAAGLAFVYGGASPVWLLAAPTLFGTLAVAVILFRYPLLNLSVVLALSVVTIGQEVGIQLTEVVYGPYYLLYLAHWYATRLLVYREPVAPHWGDRCLAAFFVGLALSASLTALHGGALSNYVSEASAWAMLGFYFPVREAVVRYRHGGVVVFGLLVWITLFVALRNLSNYQELIAAAVVAEVAGGRRVDMSNAVLMAGAMVLIGAFAAARRGWPVVAAGAALLPVVLALLITQSRALWVVTVIGAALAFVFGRGAQRTRVLALAGVGTFGAAVLLFAIAGDRADAVVAGFTRRFLSLGRSTRDISLLSRIYEAEAVWDRVVRNPVLGYGIAVPYTVYDIITQKTYDLSYIHNGFTALAYKFGVWGVALVLGAWASLIGRALRAFRRASAGSVEGAAALGCFLMLTALVVLSNTSNPFHNGDSLLMLGVVGGLTSGLHARLAGSALRP